MSYIYAIYDSYEVDVKTYCISYTITYFLISVIQVNPSSLNLDSKYVLNWEVNAARDLIKRFASSKVFPILQIILFSRKNGVTVL